MLLQFTVVKDSSLWICDTQFLKYARVSAPPVPGDDNASIVLFTDKLVPMGFGVYRFSSIEKDTHGAGILSIGVYVVGIGSTVKIFIRANVEIKDFTMPAPINKILYEILPTDPRQIESSIQEMQSGGAQILASSPSEPKETTDVL